MVQALGGGGTLGKDMKSSVVAEHLGWGPGAATALTRLCGHLCWRGGGGSQESGLSLPPTSLQFPNFLSAGPMASHHPCVPLLLLLLGTCPLPGSSEAQYKPGDPVMLYVNKVGPYHNPQETYHYYQLPVCSPEKIRHKSLTLGEVLDGDRMAESLYQIRFRENVEKRTLCEMKLSPDQVAPYGCLASSLVLAEARGARFG